MTNPYSQSLYIGFDTKEIGAFSVARESARDNTWSPMPIRGLILDKLMDEGLYVRPTERRLGKLYDILSVREDYDGQASTEFAISRFLVPIIARSRVTRPGWAMFMDCDMLVRSSLDVLFASLDRRRALYCVQHQYAPQSGEKMDGFQQTAYPRKNWSSMMIFNIDHPANQALTLEMVNTLPGRDLHRFCWLEDSDIGELDPAWNWLVGEQPEPEGGAKIVHWTRGGPWLNAFRDEPYADDYRKYLHAWAA